MVFGSGRFASSVAAGLVTQDLSCELILVGRHAHSVRALATTTSMRARAVGSGLRVEVATCDFHDRSGVRQMIDHFDPRIVLCCVSHQSPWEGKERASAWSALMSSTGIAGALTLHIDLASELAAACAESDSAPWFLNAAYPDLVNPALHRMGLPVLAGVGNAQVTHLALAAAHGVAAERVAVTAHHLHLGVAGEQSEALAWVDGRPVPDVTEALRQQRSAPRSSVNAVGGLAAARVISALIGGPSSATALPGIGGDVGGYPAFVDEDGVSVRLPAGMTRAEMVEKNVVWSALEGVTFDDEDGDPRVVFEEPVRKHLAPVLGSLALGYPLRDYAAVKAEFEVVRSDLRSRPSLELPRVVDPGGAGS